MATQPKQHTAQLLLVLFPTKLKPTGGHYSELGIQQSLSDY